MPGAKTDKRGAADFAIRDLKRDWEGWSSWERRFTLALAAASFAASLVWLVLSLGMMF